MSKAFIYKFANLRLGLFDLGGVLYHANYFGLYEEAREACLQEIGFHYSEFVKENCHLAIRESRQDFRKPVAYGESVSLSLSITNIKATSFIVHYEITPAGSDTVLHTASTKMVFVKINDDKRVQATKIPAALKAKLEQYPGEGGNE